MKKNLKLFAAIVLTLSVVISMFPAAFANGTLESLSTNSLARVPMYSTCPYCGAYDTVSYLGITKTPLGEGRYYLEWTYYCSACNFTFYVYVH